MKLAIICFTFTGWETASKLCEHLEQQGIQAELAKKSRYLPDSISCSIGEWTAEKFSEADGILFVGASGIAVRSIAPCLTSKTEDPAVLVIDECGKFVISLLSGHLGGANALAKEVASCLGAIPVITTATDLHERFAVDVFAKEQQCEIFPMSAAKEVSAALLKGLPVGFYSEFPWEGMLPQGLLPCNADGFPDRKAGNADGIPDQNSGNGNGFQDRSDREGEESSVSERLEIGIAVSIHKKVRPFETTVYLVPKITALGMGCRKGKDRQSLQMAAEETLQSAGIFLESLFSLASISLKKEEAGMIGLAKELKIPFLTFTEEELRQTPGDFTSSAFVRQITGVDNICERSAVRAAGQGLLLRKKEGADGVTTALARKEWRIVF